MWPYCLAGLLHGGGKKGHSKNLFELHAVAAAWALQIPSAPENVIQGKEFPLGGGTWPWYQETSQWAWRNVCGIQWSSWLPLPTPSLNCDGKCTHVVILAWEGHSDQELTPFCDGVQWCGPLRPAQVVIEENPEWIVEEREDENQGGSKTSYRSGVCISFHQPLSPSFPQGGPLEAWKSSPWTKLMKLGTSLVVQWLKIHLPMLETQVPSLAWEDPTCCRTA